MKRILSFAFFLLVGTVFVAAQTSLTMNIFHKLGEEDFAFNQPALNNIDHQFQVDRLEYYISQMSIVHDGGMETAINDLYILVDASEVTAVELGNHDITQIETIRFFIGVDSVANHSDPASYASDHPLAPQFPSMHWGWASGYRFVAIEGFSGTQLDQNFEIHALGDQNYFQAEVALDAVAVNGAIEIDLKADYAKALNYIELNSGVVNHGFDEEALSLLLNFKSTVFSDANASTSAADLANIKTFEIYPNPSSGLSSLDLSLEQVDAYEVVIKNMIGQTIQSYPIETEVSNTRLELKHQGVYIVSLMKEGKVIRSEKLIITQ